MSKKNIRKIKLNGTYSYNAYIDSPELDELKIIVFNHGTQSKKYSRTNQHKNNCKKCEYPLKYNVIEALSTQDRIINGKIIHKNYDSEFVQKVGKKLDSKPILLKNASRYIKNLFLEARLSETECILIHYTNKEECIKNLEIAIDEVNNEWYYTDKTLRVDINGYIPAEDETVMSVRPFPINRQTRRLLNKTIKDKTYKIALVQGLRAAEYLYTKINTLEHMIVYISEYDIQYNQDIYNEFKKINNIELIFYDTNDKIKELYMNNKKTKFDIIIANPPYGEIGAQITQNIINNIDYKDFVLMMQQSDFKVHKKYKTLFKNIKPNSIINTNSDCFSDAHVRPIICLMSKEKSNMTKEEFDVLTYVESLQKFYIKNIKRTHYAIDRYANQEYLNTLNTNAISINRDEKTAFYVCMQAANNGVPKISTERAECNWNIYHTLKWTDLTTTSATKRLSMGFIYFDTIEECENFSEFWYNGKLMNKLLKGMNKAHSCSSKPALPKVDWTRKWTDEEILIDYGYTDEEIKTILED